jgi:DNA-binding LacI/PurR family transcriptional regulator
MLGSITRACAQRGYDLLVSFQQQSSNWHEEYEDSRKADGLILLGYGDYLQYRGRLERLVEQGTHFVHWGAVQAGQPGLSVGSDNYRGGYDATRHLTGLGRRNIAFLGSASSHYPEFFERCRGYRQALNDAGAAASSSLQVDAITTEQSGHAAATELLDRGQRFDAIIAASDLIAIGAIHALQERNIDVPAEVSVVGFDDIPAASITNPPLTTIAQNTRLAGEVLVETLLRQVRDEPSEAKMLPTRLVVRRDPVPGAERAAPEYPRR